MSEHTAQSLEDRLEAVEEAEARLNDEVENLKRELEWWNAHLANEVSEF